MPCVSSCSQPRWPSSAARTLTRQNTISGSASISMHRLRLTPPPDRLPMPRPPNQEAGEANHEPDTYLTVALTRRSWVVLAASALSGCGGGDGASVAFPVRAGPAMWRFPGPAAPAFTFGDRSWVLAVSGSTASSLTTRLPPCNLTASPADHQICAWAWSPAFRASVASMSRSALPAASTPGPLPKGPSHRRWRASSTWPA